MSEEVLQRTRMGADDDQDLVVIRLGTSRPSISYQAAFELAQSLRMGCKEAARYDRVPANFWLNMDLEDIKDRPKTHRGFRRSMLIPTVEHWEVRTKEALVALVFDKEATMMHYEDGIRLHRIIFRAMYRAKAWAGDTTRPSRMLAMLTNAEDDYRLGLM